MKIAPVFKALVLVALATSLTIGDADAQSRRSQKEKEQVDYPNAERNPPKPSSSSRVERDLRKLFDLYNEGDDMPGTIEQAEKILQSDRAKDYDKAMANMLAGSAAVGMDDLDMAIPYLEAALAADMLGNNNHFGVMKMLASVYGQADQPEKAAAMVDRLMKETRSETAEMYALKGGILYNAEKFAEAADALKKAVDLSTPEAPAEENWLQMLLTSYAELGRNAEAVALGEQLQRQSPEDKRTLINLVSLYSQNDMDDKAVALLDQARAKGMLTEQRDYENLYATYMNMDGGEAKAAQAIQEGLDKGILPADLKTYNYLAQSLYFSDQIDAAINAFGKAASLDTSGETHLTLAKILSNEADREAETIAAAREALRKGVKQPGEAWMAIGRAEYYSDNLAKAQEAYREAAKDPSTREQALKTLSQISR